MIFRENSPHAQSDLCPLIAAMVTGLFPAPCPIPVTGGSSSPSSDEARGRTHAFAGSIADDAAGNSGPEGVLSVPASQSEDLPAVAGGRKQGRRHHRDLRDSLNPMAWGRGEHSG
jgi:hypothetical protein